MRSPPCAVGARPPRIGLSMPLLQAAARGNDLAAGLLRRDLTFALVGLRMAELMSPLDHSKAEAELGWNPNRSPTPSPGPRGSSRRRRDRTGQ